VLDGLDAASATGGRRDLPARTVLPGPSGMISLQMACSWSTREVRALTLAAAGAEQLWDERLPLEVNEVPQDLAALDEPLGDPALLAPIAARWEQSARERGRPSLAIETYVRLMVIKHRCGRGYETLVSEVFGLAAPAALLPHRARRAGARRVDGAQAHAPARSRRRGRDHARADRQGDARDALPGARKCGSTRR
jgi:hypothetical protein